MSGEIKDTVEDKNKEEKKESLSAKIGKTVRKLTDSNEIRNIWDKPSGGKFKHGCFHSKTVSDADYREMKECIARMKATDDYSEYKKWFDQFCKLCMIPTDGCIIQHYIFNKGEDNKNEVTVTYTNTRHKIQIPAGYDLYHSSQIDNLKELKPFFKGKEGKFSYLYSSPRIYLTVRKHLPNVCVDLGRKVKTTLYKTKENLRVAYVDPLLPKHAVGAIYVDTKFPIPVEKVPEEKKVKETTESSEEPVFKSVEEFANYYGLQIDKNYNPIMESFQTTLGSIERGSDADEFFKKTWNGITKNIEHDKIFKNISDKEKEKLDKKYSVLKTSKDYSAYKNAYIDICKWFGLEPEKTSIGLIKFYDKDEEHDTFSVKIRYHQGGRVRLIIPNNLQLIHTSPNGNIKELSPFFRSKVCGLYMWPTKRIYFTLGKGPDPNKVGDKRSKFYTYTPKENIRTAYIDSVLPEYSTKCVYVDTSFPIPVRNLTKEAEDIKKTLDNAKYNVGNIEEEK